MARTIDPRLADVPLRNLKVDEPARQNLTPDGALIELAMNRAGLEPKQLADAMKVSTSFLQRGFKDIEQISYQRLQRAGRVYPRFKRELLEVQAADTDGVEVVTEIRVKRIA